MPSKTKKQARFMAACAHGADYPGCPSEKVAKDFNKHDKKTGILKGKHKVDEALNDYKQLSVNVAAFGNPGHPATERVLRAGSIVVIQRAAGQRFVLVNVYKGNLRGMWYIPRDQFQAATRDQSEVDVTYKSAIPPNKANVSTVPTALGRMMAGEDVRQPTFKEFLIEGEYKIHPHYDIPEGQKKMILEIYRRADYDREKFVSMMKSQGMNVMELVQKPAYMRIFNALKFR